MTDLKQKILTAVVEDLQSIETALAAHLKPHFQLVEDIAGHILFAGGKRLRPLLMVLAARSCGYQGDHLSKYAVIFELTGRTGTLARLPLWTGKSARPTSNTLILH